MGRNVVWIGLAGVAAAGLGAFLFLAPGGEVTNGRPPPRAETPDGEAKSVTVQASKQVRSLEERTVSAPPIERPAAPDDASNLVLVILTAARRDQLTPYGAAQGITPFLGRLAGRGARFLDTVADAPSPRAASAAMLTGHHSWNLGIAEPGPKASQRTVPSDVPLLAERLRAAGWTTLGVTGNFNLNQDPAEGPSQGGIGRGFDTHVNAQEQGFAKGRRQEAGFVVTQAISLLEEREERPFFLQLNFIDTHAPVRVVPDELGDFEPDVPNAAYRAALHRVDGQLERLSVELEARELLDSTYIVVVADHGEGLNTPEHHGKFHGRLLYETSMVVPWIVAGPDVPSNQLVGGLSAGVDVAPTLLDLLGLPVAAELDGMSHAAVLRGQGARTRRDEAYAATWQFTAKRASRWTSARQCQVDFGSASVTDSFVDACYDRRIDPSFTRVVDDPDALQELRSWADAVDAELLSDGAE